MATAIVLGNVTLANAGVQGRWQENTPPARQQLEALQGSGIIRPMGRFWRAYVVFTWGVLHRYYGNKNGVVGEYETAVRYFSRALAIDPRLRLARLARANLLWRELGRPADAIADFDALLADDDQDGEALFNRAMAHQGHGRYAEALADIDHTLTLSELDPSLKLTAQRQRILLRDLLSEDSAD